MHRLLPVVVLLALAPLLMAPPYIGCSDCHEHWTEDDVPTDDEYFYSFAATAGQRYDIVLRPSAGDPDLYLADDSAISQSNFDCRPYLGGTTEEVCTITPTSSGT